MQLREKIVRISNKLLNYNIITILSKTDFNNIKKTFYLIINFIEKFNAKQRKVYKK